MAYPEFYNTNKNIKYPFINPRNGRFLFDGGFNLPDKAVVDCGFTLGAALNGVSGAVNVWLNSISRAGNTITLVFQCDASGMNGETFVFTRNLVQSTFGATQYVTLSTPARGTGFLVTGDMSAFATFPDGTTQVALKPPLADDSVPYVEPGLVTTLRGHSVTSIQVCNKPRPVGVNCCETQALPANSVVTVGSPISGDVVVRPGYSVLASANASDNSITITGALGAGKGVTCNDSFGGETTPQCKDLIYTVNGVKPADNGALTFSGHSGIYVDTYPSQHLIVIRGELTTQVECATNG